MTLVKAFALRSAGNRGTRAGIFSAGVWERNRVDRGSQISLAEECHTAWELYDGIDGAAY